MAADKEGTVRRDPEEPKRTATKTGLPDKAHAYFIFHTRNGGFYSDGKTEGVSEWTELQ